MPTCHDDFNYSERMKMRNVYECRTPPIKPRSVYTREFCTSFITSTTWSHTSHIIIILWYKYSNFQISWIKYIYIILLYANDWIYNITFNVYYIIHSWQYFNIICDENIQFHFEFDRGFYDDVVGSFLFYKKTQFLKLYIIYIKETANWGSKRFRFAYYKSYVRSIGMYFIVFRG